jgi:hypothetical protein
MVTRPRPARPLVAALAVTVAAWLAAAAADPAWAQAIGVDVWNVGRLEADLAASAAAGERLRAAGDWQLARFEMNQQVVAELAAGRVRLLDAAREMYEGNRDVPGYRAMLPARFPHAPTPEAQSASDLLYRVRIVLDKQPARREAALARLQAEYDATFTQK